MSLVGLRQPLLKPISVKRVEAVTHGNSTIHYGGLAFDFWAELPTGGWAVAGFQAQKTVRAVGPGLGLLPRPWSPVTSQPQTGSRAEAGTVCPAFQSMTWGPVWDLRPSSSQSLGHRSSGHAEKSTEAGGGGSGALWGQCQVRPRACPSASQGCPQGQPRLWARSMHGGVLVVPAQGMRRVSQKDSKPCLFLQLTPKSILPSSVRGNTCGRTPQAWVELTLSPAGPAPSSFDSSSKLALH